MHTGGYTLHLCKDYIDQTNSDAEARRCFSDLIIHHPPKKLTWFLLDDDKPLVSKTGETRCHQPLTNGWLSWTSRDEGWNDVRFGRWIHSGSRLQTWIDRRLGGEVTAHIDSKGYGFSVKQQPETKRLGRDVFFAPKTERAG